MPIIRMFIQYAGTSKQKYQDFIERKLDQIIRWLQLIVNDSALESKYKEQIKAGMRYEDFETLMKPIENASHTVAKNTKFKIEDKGFEIELIESYKDLHKKYGGSITGYKGRSEWCHTNGKSTYESWTNAGSQQFFVIYHKDFKNIKPPLPLSTNAYDKYGTSLMAILVDVKSLKLLNCTLRWNHVIEPKDTIPGRTVDKAFIDFNEISKVVGFDVKARVKQLIKKIQEKYEKTLLSMDQEVQRILANATTIESDTIPADIKERLTRIKIPKNITSIGDEAFYNCTMLKSVTIPSNVKSIGDRAFFHCIGLKNVTISDGVEIIYDFAFSWCTMIKSITIPSSVKSIGEGAFYNCRSLTSVTIPSSVTSIGDEVFNMCDKKLEIHVPSDFNISKLKNSAIDISSQVFIDESIGIQTQQYIDFIYENFNYLF